MLFMNTYDSYVKICKACDLRTFCRAIFPGVACSTLDSSQNAMEDEDCKERKPNEPIHCDERDQTHHRQWFVQI